VQGLQGLARSGLQWPQLTPGARGLVEGLLLRARGSQLGPALWACGCLCLPASDLDEADLTLLLREVTTSLALGPEGGDPKRLGLLLSALSRMGLRWGDLPSDLHRALGLQVGSLRGVMGPTDVR